MRVTQHIGLTRRAEKFVSGLPALSASRTFEGACGDVIKLRDWRIEDAKDFPTGTLIREVVQALPWSSGAMVFTCLEVEYPNGEKKQFHQWIASPFEETNREDGTFWV